MQIFQELFIKLITSLKKKTVSTKFSFANGVSHQKEYFLDTNFVVFLTDREELENKEFLNTAALILLDSKMTYEDGKKDNLI